MNLWSQSHSRLLALMLGHTGWCEHMTTVIWAFFLFKKAMASPTLLHEVPPWQLNLSSKYESGPGCPSSHCLGLPKTPRGSTSVNPLPTPASQHPPLRPHCTGSLSTEDTWVSAEGRGCDAKYKCYFCNLRPDPEPSVPAGENGQMLNEQKQHSDKALLWRVNEMT